MIELHLQYIEKDGQTQFVVLALEEFQSLRDHIEDMEDRLDLRNAKAEVAGAPTVTLNHLESQHD